MQKYKWKVLPADSSIQLRVRYMNIGLINASFKKFKGDMIAGAEFSEAIISFEIESKAIDTQDAQLNKTLCSEPFLFVEKFPNICFFSKSGCHKSSGGIQELTGDLFIKGHSKSLTLIVNYSNFRTKGSIQMVNFNLLGKVNLKTFAIGHSFNNELGEELQINASICLRRLQKVVQDFKLGKVTPI